MDDPFGHLRKKRELREERLRKEQAREEQAFEKRNRRIQELQETYHELVVSVLEQLRLAAYPEYQVELQHRSPQEIGIWSIGYSVPDEYTSYWNSVIRVELTIDSNVNPIRFECFYGKGRLRTTAGLSRKELIAALKKLMSQIEQGEPPAENRNWLEKLFGG